MLLEKEMRDCLTKIERRQAIGRKLGISLAAVVPRKIKEARPSSPVKQVLGGFAAVAVFLLMAAAAAEYFFPDKIPYFHRSEKIGVQIGVPDAAKFATTPTQSTGPASVAANLPQQSASPAIAEADQNPPPEAQQNQPQQPKAPPSTPVIASNQTNPAPQQPEPPSPALGPSEPPAPSTAAAPESSEQSSTADATESTAHEKTKDTAANSSRRSTSRRARESYEDEASRPPIRQARHHAEVVGRTRDGRLIVRLSNGRVLVLPRVKDEYPSYPRRRVYTERPDDYAPPLQPFNQND